MTWSRVRAESALLATSVGLLAAGGLTWGLGARDLATHPWIAGTVLGLLASVATTIRAVRRREPTVDVIAVLALAGALAVGEPFAGAVVTVMLATGQLLEARAQARAQRELSLLVQRMPQTARRRVSSGVEEVPVERVALGDILVVASGEVVPVDARLLTPGEFDESALTGEPLPVQRPVGDIVRSGIVVAGASVDLVATAPAAESTYAGLVRLVEQAQASSAPLVRTADRFAVLFVPLTLLLAGAAWMIASDPVRAVAVLVVATPCPLLLAAPIAIMSGLSRTARAGVIVKGGGALEQLARGRVILFDKTGTLTQGRPVVTDVVLAPDGIDADTALRLAASVEQLSPHVLASAVVAAATGRNLPLSMPEAVCEEHGYGLSGTVEGRRVAVGKADWVVGHPQPAWARQVRRRAELDSSLMVFVAVDGRPAGALLLQDSIRADAPRMVRALRDAGIERVVLLTGDRQDTADTVGRIVGVDTVLADCDPTDKLAAIEEESTRAATIMVGDGINDAPALAASGVGVALAARGATASSEAADVVLTVDRVDALADAILIAGRARRIAIQAVVTGMALSVLAMLAAAAGFLPPAAGAVLQEGIDLLAIAIALRAVLPGRLHTITLSPQDAALIVQLRAEHDAVLADVERIRTVADALTTTSPDLAGARELLTGLQDNLIPHERDDEELLLPVLTRALGNSEAAAALSRTHAEIEHQVSRLHRLLAGLEGEETTPEDVIELRRLLYGLYAVLRLHNAQEEEGAFTLIPTTEVTPGEATAAAESSAGESVVAAAQSAAAQSAAATRPIRTRQTSGPSSR